MLNGLIRIPTRTVFTWESCRDCTVPYRIRPWTKPVRITATGSRKEIPGTVRYSRSIMRWDEDVPTCKCTCTEPTKKWSSHVAVRISSSPQYCMYLCTVCSSNGIFSFSHCLSVSVSHLFPHPLTHDHASPGTTGDTPNHQENVDKYGVHTVLYVQRRTYIRSTWLGLAWKPCRPLI